MTLDPNIAAKAATLKDILRRSSGVYIFIGIFSFFINTLMLVGPLYMMQVYDRVIATGSMPTLTFLTVAAVALILCSAIVEFVRTRILVGLSARLDETLNRDVFTGLLDLSLIAGNAKTQPLKDMDTVLGFITGRGLILLFDAPWTPFFLLIIFLMHPLLGVVALLGALLLFGTALMSELITKNLVAEAAVANSDAEKFASGALRNAEVIEGMGMLGPMTERWLKQHRKAFSLKTIASDRAGALTAFSKFVRPVLQIAILGVGAYLAINNQITGGAIIAASIIMGRALAPVEGAIGAWRSFVLSRVAYKRLSAYVSQLSSGKNQLKLPEPKGAIDITNLVATAPNSTTPIIKGISFSVEAGNILGIIGPSGAGKSTLARLLMGIWQPASGHVRLDGVDIANWNHEVLGPYLGFLPQDIELFDGTVADNISRFSEPNAEKIIAAAENAGVHQMILQLEHGYDTYLGEGGAVLSAGRRQRVALARALYGDPAFVVLDEPNSNLDSEGEEALRRAIIKAKERGATVAIIAHRASVLSVTDKLLVLEDGKVQLFGDREKIIANLAVASGREKEKGGGGHRLREVV